VALQLAGLVEKDNRNFDERRPAGAAFLGVPKLSELSGPSVAFTN
jgi:hypothetical protein